MTEQSDKELKAAARKGVMEEANIDSIDSEETKAQTKVATSTLSGVLEVIVNDDDAPLPPAHIAALHPSIEIVKDDGNSAGPLPMEQMAASTKVADDTACISAMKMKIESNVVLPQVAGVDSDAQREQHRLGTDERILPISQTSDNRNYSSTSISDGVKEVLDEPVAFPPKSVRRQSDIVCDTVVSTMEASGQAGIDQSERTPAFTVLEATLVDDVVYDAIPFEMVDQETKMLPLGDDSKDQDVTHSTRDWCKKHARVLVGLVIVAVVSTVTIILTNKNKKGKTQDTAKTATINITWEEPSPPLIGNRAGDELGTAVALSADGSILAVGAAGSYVDLDRIGYVKLYMSRNGTNWEQIGVDIKGNVTGDNFGASVALSADGTALAVGAPSFGVDSADKNATPGYFRVYSIVGGDDSLPNWKQIGQEIKGEAPADNFGAAVSISGDGKTVAVSGMRNDGNGTNSGHVRIYHINESGYVWTQLGNNAEEKQSNSSGWIEDKEFYWTQLGEDIDGEATEDLSGYSLSLSRDGRTVAIGSPYNTGGPDLYSGQVRVYFYDNTVF